MTLSPQPSPAHPQAKAPPQQVYELDPLADLADHPDPAPGLPQPWSFRFDSTERFCAQVLARRLDPLRARLGPAPRPGAPPEEIYRFCVHRLVADPPATQEIFAELAELTNQADRCLRHTCDCPLAYWHEVAVREADALLATGGEHVWMAELDAPSGLDRSPVLDHDGWLTVGALHARVLYATETDDHIARLELSGDATQVVATFSSRQGPLPPLRARPLPAPSAQAWRLAEGALSGPALLKIDQGVLAVIVALSARRLQVLPPGRRPAAVLQEALKEASVLRLADEPTEVLEVAASLAASWDGDLQKLLDAAREL